MNVVDLDVSIIVPMYNVENLIEETLQSITKNKCNFEVLIINDGSTDQSLSRATEFSKKDERFKVISQKNQGVSVARNLGLSLAQGDFICFVDSDDLLTPNALDKMLAAAKNNNADFVYGAVNKFNNKRKWFLDAHVKNNLFTSGEKKLSLNPEVLFSIGVASKLISKKILKGLSFPLGMKFTEDSYVMYQCYLKSNKMYCIEDIVYLYRERDLLENEASATQQKQTKSLIYLNDAFVTIKKCRYETLNSSNFTKEEKFNILNKYYGRFFAYEVWPVFFAVLKNDKKNINNALKGMLEFLKIHTVEEINSISVLRYYLIKILIDKIYLLSNLNFSTYRSLIKFLIENLSEKVQKTCARKNVYGEKWLDSYKIAFLRMDKALIYFNIIKNKKFIFNKIKNDPQFVREKYFPLLSKLPVEKNKVVFATNRKKPMASNFSTVYEALKNENVKVYKFLGETNSVKTLLNRYYHIATAEVVFLEDYYKPIYGLNFRKETKVVQLWHACGAFKKFAFAALGSDDSNSLEFESAAHNMYTQVCVSAENLVPIYADSFNIDKHNIIPVGVPRTDYLFNDDKKSSIKNKVLKKYPDLRNTINIVYAPTFRGSSAVRYRFNLNLDWAMISSTLPPNYKLIIKLHPVVKEVYPPIPDFVKDKVVLMPSSESIDDLMVFCDCLITDYSSVIFEYSLLAKPLILFPYDIESYFDERGFYYAYEEYAYGDMAYNTFELIQAIKNAKFKYSDFELKRKLFIKQFMSNCDGRSTKRLLKIVLDK